MEAQLNLAKLQTSVKRLNEWRREEAQSLFHLSKPTGLTTFRHQFQFYGRLDWIY